MRQRFTQWSRSLLMAMLFGGAALEGRAQQAVTIELNNTPAAADDYLCWTPIRARARLATAGSNRTVTIRSATNAKLFAATRDNRLWARDSQLRDIAWQQIGAANNVVGMAWLGNRLFAATRDNRLWVRDPVLLPLPWAPIGHANAVVAMTALGDKLYAATSDNRFWMRDPVLADLAWQQIGSANNVVALAAANGMLFAATRNNRLLMRLPVPVGASWTDIGHANNVVAMTASGGRLFAATSDNRLWEREATPANLSWRVIGHADNVAAMAAASESGGVAFLTDPLPSPGTALTPTSSLSLLLPGDGSWRSFFVVGRRPSIEDKDAAVIATDSAGGELGRNPLMVRVRKNAESLTDGERRRFLRAFAGAAQRNNQFAKYWGIHTDAGNMGAAHDVAFLPWHRALLLQIERELQAEDPSVSMPYWEFDKVAPKLFTEDFIGRVSPSDAVVRFSASNPLGTVTLSHPTVVVSPLVRLRNGDTSVSASLNKDFMSRNTHTLMRTAIWAPYHGFAHTHIGGIVGDINRSPADPLFFLLHTNVDRAWAAWQRQYDRFDRAQTNDYGFQGSHGASSPHPLGNYVDDTMWPWDGLPRSGSTVVYTTLPVNLPPNPGPGAGIVGAPQVGEALDYLDIKGAGKSHGFCYDSLPYGTGPVTPFWP